MLSRVADSIYWLNRYVERAKNIARFVDVNLNLLLDSPSLIQQWQPIVITTGDLALFQERYGEVTQANVIKFLTFERDDHNSILSCLRFATENARSRSGNYFFVFYLIFPSDFFNFEVSDIVKFSGTGN